MKTDRELLELAAKAIGRKVKRVACDANSFGGLFFEDHDSDAYAWNPLLDDGEALQLAVKLDMSVEISAHEDSTYAYCGPQPRVYGYEMWAGDKLAATRRAIVRAAAEFGLMMP